MNLCFPLFLASLQSVAKSFVSTDGGSSGSKDAFIASVVVVVGCIIIVIIFTTILRGNDFLLCIELWTIIL